jgi:hypothetical protein
MNGGNYPGKEQSSRFCVDLNKELVRMEVYGTMAQEGIGKEQASHIGNSTRPFSSGKFNQLP